MEEETSIKYDNISQFGLGHPYSRNTPLESKVLREHVVITVGNDQLNEYGPEYNVNHIY